MKAENSRTLQITAGKRGSYKIYEPRRSELAHGDASTSEYPRELGRCGTPKLGRVTAHRGMLFSDEDHTSIVSPYPDCEVRRSSNRKEWFVRRQLLLFAPCILFLTSCASGPPIYEGLGELNMPVATSSAEAQRYFDQGYVLCWGFNHEEALRSFEEAIRLDSHCAMAWWGVAFALGPNINLPLVDAARGRRAYDAVQKARELSGRASKVEQALILALAQRFSDPPPDDRAHLDLAYAVAMRDVYQRFPADPDVAILFVDSLMNINLRASEFNFVWASEINARIEACPEGDKTCVVKHKMLLTEVMLMGEHYMKEANNLRSVASGLQE